MNKASIKLKYIDVLDEEGTFYFKKAMKIFAVVFKEDKFYIKTIKQILKRKLHPVNTIFRILIAIDKEKQLVLGVCIYRHWIDINRTTLEYIMTRPKLTGCGIGTLLYRKLKTDLKAMGSKGLFFSCAGDVDLEKYQYMTDEYRKNNRLRVKFYENLGARPLLGLRYNSPLCWWFKKDVYCYPNFCYDPLSFKKIKHRVRVQSKLVTEIIKRIMLTYYGFHPSNHKVKNILNSITTKQLEWRPARYSKETIRG